LAYLQGVVAPVNSELERGSGLSRRWSGVDGYIEIHSIGRLIHFGTGCRGDVHSENVVRVGDAAPVYCECS
jgi:hypothetical protein